MKFDNKVKKLKGIIKGDSVENVLIAIGKRQNEWRKKEWYTWLFLLYEGMGVKQPWFGFHAYSHLNGWALLKNKKGEPLGWWFNKSIEKQDKSTINFLYSILTN